MARRIGLARAMGLAVALAVSCCSCSCSSGAAVTADDEPSGSVSETTVATTAPETDASVPSVGPRDCGRFDRAGGWPTTVMMSPRLGRCLRDAFDSGAAALLVVSEQTDGRGGSPVVTTYLVIGPRRVLVRVDASAAVDRPPEVTISQCERLDVSVSPPAVSHCSPWG